MKIPRVNPFLAVILLLSCILASVAPAAPTASAPDEYEAEPYIDNTALGSRNFYPDSEPPQFHTIHDTTDEDWIVGLFNSSDPTGNVTSIQYSVTLTGLDIPAGSALFVEFFADGPPFGGGSDAIDCNESEALPCYDNVIDMGSRSLAFSTNSFDAVQVVYIRVSLIGTSANETTPVEYAIQFERTTGANNSIVGTIGTTLGSKGGPQVAGPIWFGLDSGTSNGTTVANLNSLRVYRSFYNFSSGEVSPRVLIAEFDAPINPCTGCQTTRWNVKGFDRGLLDNTCLVSIDTGLEALGLLPNTPVYYEVFAVRDGSEDPDPWFLPSPYVAVYQPATTITLPPCNAVVPTTTVPTTTVPTTTLPTTTVPTTTVPTTTIPTTTIPTTTVPTTTIPTPTPTPILLLDTTSIEGTITQGENLATNSLEILNDGGGDLNWQASWEVDWITVDPASGTATAKDPSVAEISFDTAGLSSSGSPYTATVLFEGNPLGGVQALTITLTVLAPKSEAFEFY